jgi:glyoxylase-like metal-dependent hydrolase (beta-lactamase superfamily II)
MRVRHLNCGTMLRGVVDHCLLIETERSGLVLVDTGFGLDVVANPTLLGWSRHLIGPALQEHECAVEQIKSLGYDPRDVRNILLTHLDYDHTSGLADFPHAAVHVHPNEYQSAMNPTQFERTRYRPRHMWGHGVDWHIAHDSGGETWNGFEGVRQINGLPAEILMVPLPGHTRGHAGYAIETRDGWLLHAGDAFTFPSAINKGLGGAASRAFHLIYAHPSSPTLMLRNMQRLTDLASSTDLDIVSSHDPKGLHRRQHIARHGVLLRAAEPTNEECDGREARP